MNEIYDNGTIILGNVKNIRDYTIKQFENGIIEDWERDEILEELKELKEDNIVAVNYDCGMGLKTDYWEVGDIIDTNI